MYLTLALPALNFNPSAQPPEVFLPSLNKMMRFGVFRAEAARPSEFYGRFLWHGSLLAHAKSALGIDSAQAAVFASPVWQQMGMHAMDMLGGADIGILPHEAETLCRGLSSFLQSEGWQFYPLRPDLWLATLPEADSDWEVPPLPDVLGRLDGSVRAEGAGSRRWLQRQTEIQMWLHAHPLNTERAAAQKPVINGVWLWRDLQGSGPQDALLGSNSPWAQFYGGARVGAPDGFEAWLEAVRGFGAPVSDGLLFLDDLAVTAHTDDGWAYREILENWEQRWFAPLWQALQQGRLKGLCVATDGAQGGRLEVKPKAARAFWKKKKFFSGQLGGR